MPGVGKSATEGRAPPVRLGPAVSAAVVSLALLALRIVQNSLQLCEELHAAMHRLVQHLAQQLSWKITQLLPDHEMAQDQNMVTGNLLLLATLKQWFFWAFALGAGALLLLLCLCWRNRKRSCNLQSICYQEEEVEEEEEEELEDDDSDDDSGDISSLGRCVSHHIHWPVRYMEDKCKVVEELVDELLSACHRLSRNHFNLLLQPAIGAGCVYEAWSAQENNVVYRLFVPLQPPPGHVFYLELDTTKTLTSSSCLRVQLQCMCMREWLVEDVLCFLHHSKDELKSQGPSLLKTLCTNSYLDIRKTTSWFQMLVKDAWQLMPLSHHCQLAVLPTTSSCKLKLKNGQESLNTELILGVFLGDSDCFVMLE